LDANGNGSLSWEEWEAHFSAIYKDVKEEKEQWLKEALVYIGKVFQERKLAMKGAFITFDARGNGNLTYNQVCCDLLLFFSVTFVFFILILIFFVLIFFFFFLLFFFFFFFFLLCMCVCA
jgi:Flp pilus assembly protein TadB